MLFFAIQFYAILFLAIPFDSMLCYAVGCFLAASFALLLLLPAGLLVAVAVGYRSSASLLLQHGA